MASNPMAGGYETGTLLSETWGTITYVHDIANHICYCRLAGNANPAPYGHTSINLPDKLKPTIPMLSPLFGGGYIEIPIEGTPGIYTVGETWQAGSLVWPTA